jgi:hypothetical protein
LEASAALSDLPERHGLEDAAGSRSYAQRKPTSDLGSA